MWNDEDGDGMLRLSTDGRQEYAVGAGGFPFSVDLKQEELDE